MINQTDQALIQEYKSTESLEVLGDLYDRYMPLVYGVCLKYLKDRDDSKDAVMQIFEKLIDQLQKHEVDNFKSWLHVLTKNHCLMAIRSSKSKKMLGFENDQVENMEYSLSLHHEDEEDKETDLNALNGCMEKLSVEQKKCVGLFYLEEKSYNEVSEESGYELKKVKSYIQNGKRNLKQCLESNAN